MMLTHRIHLASSMTRRSLARLALLVVAYTSTHAPTISAQQASTHPNVPGLAQPEFVVKTIPLRHLTSAEAMKLLSPYVQTAGGGVYEVSSNIRAVTIREIPRIHTEMMAVLNQYDRDPATVTLNFQLVAAENTATRDPTVASLDSLLRGVLKFSGYRLLTTAIATASEHGHVTQTLSADGEPLNLVVDVDELRTEGANASVHLTVELWRAGVGRSGGTGTPKILSTGLVVPIGQTVVLGTSALDGGQNQKALILTVRPQLTQRATR